MTLEERIARLEEAVFPAKKERELVSLIDWNNQRWDAHSKANEHKPRPNGIACPNCSIELVDSNPHMMMMSRPPMLAIHCRACGYKGTRVA